MNILLSVAQAWCLYIGIVLGAILVIGAVLYFTCGLRKKRETKNNETRVIVDEEFINELLLGLGEISNIENVCIDNGRLKFKVNNLDKVNGEVLKTLSTSGVFITGNNVKLLFKYDSQLILKELVNRGVSKC